MPLNLNKAPQTEAETARLAKSTIMPDGTYAAHFGEAWDDKGKKTGRAMIVVPVVVTDAEAIDHEMPLYLHTATAVLLLLRHACVAVGAEAEFNAGTISAESFSDRNVRVVIGTERKRGWRPRNVILDVLPLESADVVSLRAAAE